MTTTEHFIAGDGTKVEFLHSNPSWLYVTRTDRAVSVYRSTWLHADSETLRPAREATEGLTLVHREVVEDPSMMHRHAEHSLYADLSRS
jgi:hypothetical protein